MYYIISASISCYLLQCWLLIFFFSLATTMDQCPGDGASNVTSSVGSNDAGQEGTGKMNFGHVRRDDFSFAPGYLNINHGSFGATPKSVAEAQRVHTANMGARPDAWFRTDYKVVVNDVRSKLAAYVGATDTEDLVLVENASSGINSVLRALQYSLGADDVVAVLSSAYPMVSNTLDYLSKEKGFRVVTVDVSFPITGEEDFFAIAAKLIETVPAENLKVFVVSHITSTPAVIVPIREMAVILKAAVPALHIVVDGAHALGQIPINVSSLQAAGVDYYVANGHKWLYSPKGSAFLWVSKKAQPGIVPTVVSSEGLRTFTDGFLYTGTRDYTAFCSIGAAFDYRNMLGDPNINNYNHGLAASAGLLLSRMWQTRTVAPDRMIGSMVDVQLPTSDSSKVAAIQDAFTNEFNSYIVVYQLKGSDPPQYWTRLSAQVYLELSDFETVGSRVLEILDRPSDPARSLEPVIVKP